MEEMCGVVAESTCSRLDSMSSYQWTNLPETLGVLLRQGQFQSKWPFFSSILVGLAPEIFKKKFVLWQWAAIFGASDFC